LQADPHPGNYCFGLDGRVGFVDFGCVTIVSERRRRPFVEMVRAAIDGRKHDMHTLMVKTGFFAADSTLTADETYQLMAEIGYEFLAPQPVTFTPDSLARAIRGMIDLRSPDHPVRRMSVPDDFVFFSRHNLIMNPLFAMLDATMHTRAIIDDMDGIAEPITPIGKQHHCWVRQRGLPLGLEPHDYP
jgi:predicted unusual protein kinase regulating ubiquinone biosynthesis (AarF/ABC1/UbiB family)